MRRRSNSAPTVSFFAFQDIITSVVGIFVLVIICMILELVDSQDETSSNASDSSQLLQLVESMESEIVELQKQHDKLASQIMAATTVNAINRSEVLGDFRESESEAIARQKRILTSIAELESLLARAESEYVLLEQQSEEMEPSRQELLSIRSQQVALQESVRKLKFENPMVFRKQLVGGLPLAIVVVSSEEIRLLRVGIDEEITFTGPSAEDEFLGWMITGESQVWHFLILVKPSGVKRFDQVEPELRSLNVRYGFDVTSEDQKIEIHSASGNIP